MKSTSHGHEMCDRTQNPDTPAWADLGRPPIAKKVPKTDFGGFGDPVTSVDLPVRRGWFPWVFCALGDAFAYFC